MDVPYLYLIQVENLNFEIEQRLSNYGTIYFKSTPLSSYCVKIWGARSPDSFLTIPGVISFRPIQTGEFGV